MYATGTPLHMPAVAFQDEMLFCDSCDRGFHMECCDPPLQECQKVRRLHSLASRFPSRLSIQRLLSTDGRLRPSLRTRGDGLLEALHAYKIILASPGEICYLWITVDPTARLVMTATYGRMTICRQFIQVT